MIIKDIIRDLRRRFAEAVSRNRGEGILFSGGLDSALVAAYSGKSKAISVGLESYGEDQYYAGEVARSINLEHYHKTVKIEEAIAVIPEVIKILESFDPSIPNDVTAYLMLKIKDLEEYLALMYSAMRFSSNKIGETLGVDIKQPFLDKEFMDFSRGIDLALKIREENGKTWGKWILRKAFEGVLPQEILWQTKRPLEYGSGMTELRKVIESRVSDEEFEESKKKYPVAFWNKEHFYYYRIYREVVGEIPAPKKGQKICEWCGAGMDRNAFHCRICGGVTEWKSL
ncbi:MAG: hypothetical protein JRC60_06965 [Deltaproteobacteria bacterium]|nr:hypothetical protein [Deltaproteobacteria bacterium]